MNVQSWYISQNLTSNIKHQVQNCGKQFLCFIDQLASFLKDQKEVMLFQTNYTYMYEFPKLMERNKRQTMRTFLPRTNEILTEEW